MNERLSKGERKCFDKIFQIVRGEKSRRLPFKGARNKRTTGGARALCLLGASMSLAKLNSKRNRLSKDDNSSHIRKSIRQQNRLEGRLSTDIEDRP